MSILPQSPVRVPFWLCPLELTSSIVLVILDKERDGVKHILLSHIVPLGVVICFFDVIMFYTGVLTWNKWTHSHYQEVILMHKDICWHQLLTVLGWMLSPGGQAHSISVCISAGWPWCQGCIQKHLEAASGQKRPVLRCVGVGNASSTVIKCGNSTVCVWVQTETTLGFPTPVQTEWLSSSIDDKCW